MSQDHGCRGNGDSRVRFPPKDAAFQVDVRRRGYDVVLTTGGVTQPLIKQRNSAGRTNPSRREPLLTVQSTNFIPEVLDPEIRAALLEARVPAECVERVSKILSEKGLNPATATRRVVRKAMEQLKKESSRSS